MIAPKTTQNKTQPTYPQYLREKVHIPFNKELLQIGENEEQRQHVKIGKAHDRFHKTGKANN